MIKVILTGSKGRMGGHIATLIKGSKDLKLAAEIDRDDPLEEAISKGDVMIDFTSASAACQNARIAAEHGKPIVIGTTGLTDEQQDVIRDASKKVPVVFAPNMSIGVNLMWKLIEGAAKVLGPGYDVDIIETHHVHKLDKPSGTAKKMKDIVLKSRSGGEVEVRSIREGEVVGDHVIHFKGPGDILSIEHHAIDRGIFAEGALAAARWIIGRPPGLYGMDDVLCLTSHT